MQEQGAVVEKVRMRGSKIMQLAQSRSPHPISLPEGEGAPTAKWSQETGYRTTDNEQKLTM
jgi:hypothetical protein